MSTRVDSSQYVFLSGNNDLEKLQGSGNSYTNRLLQGLLNGSYETGTGTGSDSTSEGVISFLKRIIKEWVNSISTARGRINDGESRISDAQATAQTEFNKADVNLKDLFSGMNKTIADIDNITAYIATLSGDDKDGLKDQEKKLQEERYKITAAANILRKSQSSDTEKRSAIQDIKDAQAAIAGLIDNINATRADIESQVAEVEILQGNITDYQDAIGDCIDSTTDLIRNIAADTSTNEMREIAEMSALGTVEEVEGSGVVATASAVEGATLGTATPIAAEAIVVGGEHNVAGGIEIAGAIDNADALARTLDNISNLESYISDGTAILSDAITLAQGSIGSYDTTLEGTIGYLDSWKHVESGNALLGAAIGMYEGNNKKTLLGYDVNLLNLG